MHVRTGRVGLLGAGFPIHIVIVIVLGFRDRRSAKNPKIVWVCVVGKPRVHVCCMTKHGPVVGPRPLRCLEARIGSGSLGHTSAKNESFGCFGEALND